MRKIKKALPIALVIMALFSLLALGVSAADCDHPEFTYEDSPYDCTSNYRVYTCTTCGYSYDDQIIGVNNHDYEGEEVKAPTCTTSGTMEYTCQNCGDSYTVTIPATGHSWDENYHSPTCSTGGWSNAICYVCGVIDESQYQDYSDSYPPTGKHTYIDGVCSVCGASSADDCEHSFAYSSNSAETHILTCSKCGMAKGNEIGHVWSNRTQMEQGKDEHHYIFKYTCSVCNATKTQEESIVCNSDDDHNWLYWNVDGTYHIQNCTTCGTSGEKSPHVFGDGVVLQSPSLNVEGITRYTCTLCSYYKEEVVSALTIEDVVSRCTEKEAVDLFTAIFFYGENGDYGKFQQKLMENTDVGYWYSKYFVTEIMYDITKKGANSEFYKDFSSLYNKVMDMTEHDAVSYNKGYNDAISSVIDKNPIQGLFQGMWSSLILFITTIGNGVAIGGVSLMSVFVTIAVLALIWFVINLLKG